MRDEDRERDVPIRRDTDVFRRLRREWATTLATLEAGHEVWRGATSDLPRQESGMEELATVRLGSASVRVLARDNGLQCGTISCKRSAGVQLDAGGQLTPLCYQCIRALKWVLDAVSSQI